MFHELVNEHPLTRFSVSFSEFEKILIYIKENDIKTLSIDDLSKPINKKSTLLTFDDGHISNVIAAELLSKYGLTGVFFIVKDFSLEKEDYMSEEDIKYVFSLGHIIGVHDKSHEHWTKKTESKLINDIIETKEWLENVINSPVVICAAPAGQINERIYRIIQKNIPSLKYIRSSSPWMNNIERTRIFSTCIKFSTKESRYRMIINGNFFIYLYLQLWYKIKKLLRPIYSKILLLH